jgi:hypothetical protein
MALPFPISPSQTDAKSPVDEQLMDDIRLNLDYLETQSSLSKSFDYQFKLNGRLDALPLAKRKRIDGVLISQAATFLSAKLYLEKPGTSGTLEADVRKISVPNTPISGVSRIFSSSINTIARAGSALSTQSITRATAQIATQSVSQWKSSISISSIVFLGGGFMRYNLATAPDSDWKPGDSITISSATSGVNNGTFLIARVNDDAYPSIVVVNSSGVNQSGAAGNIRLNAWLYSYTNPVAAQFAAGEFGFFSSHADAGNNGALLIYAINQGGNNIVVKNASGVANGAAAGFADTQRWIYALSSAAPADYVALEKAFLSGHASGGNNGSFPITAVNSGGNNVVVYNPSGVVQGGSGGTVDTLRWVYFFSSDPSAGVSALDRIKMAGATTSANNGIFSVVQVNRSTPDNVVVYNESGAAQGGSGGTAETTKTLVKFASDQSAVYSTASIVEIFGSALGAIDDESFPVLQVNRGGGANYNIVIDAPNAAEQVGAGGRVIFEEKSIFSTKPSITLNSAVENSTNRHAQISTNAVLNAEAVVATGQRMAMYITKIPVGAAETAVLSLI